MSYNHIVKTSDERVLYFFINDGLCVKDLNVPSDKYKVIYEEAVCDFAVMDTGLGEVGIVCQDDKGSIIFLKESGDTFLKTTLLNNRSQIAYDKYFRLTKHIERIGLSYIINYKGKSILSFQVVDGEESAPVVVDYVNNTDYWSHASSNGDLYIFYNRKDEFGYKIFKWSQKDFIDYDSLGEGRLISAVGDGDCYYIIYERDGGFFLKVIDNRNFGFNICDYELNFIKQDDIVNIMMEKNKLWVTVNRKGFTFGKKCSIENFEFSSPYNFANEGNLINYSLCINEREYIVEKCFGYSINMRPKLILYKDLLNVKKTIKPTVTVFGEENNKEENEDIKRINIELTKLDIRLKEAEEKIKKLDKFMQNT